MSLRAAGAASLLLAAGCSKVPLTDVEAGFLIADAAWFEEEQTLFLFWEVDAQQGLGEPSVVEVTYATDDERVDWTPIDALTPVHTHLDVDCGVHTLCGSTSLQVPLEPREVELRLRYHRDGALALYAPTVYNVVAAGPDHTHRSLVVYGVFDETNQLVQWRARHSFPTLRNQEVEDLGLRRWFSVDGMRYGTAELADADNPYGYGVACPGDFAATDLGPVETEGRAAFQQEPLPLAASTDSTVCADATVTDALGTYTTGAVARKNPEVRAAFPVLRSPVVEATPIKFMLGPCESVISVPHEEMQRQRLQLEGVETWCTDDWESPDFVDRLTVALADAVEAERPAGADMVLVVGLHRDDGGVAAAVEEALARVVPAERHRTSPRLAGAFVFDSKTRGMKEPALAQTTLWCPATQDTSDLPDASARTCATLPDMPDLDLGPFSIGMVPILPNRKQYLTFIEDFGVAQAGEVTDLEYLTPELSATSRHIDLGDYGVITFLDDEILDADADDAFSYCVQEEMAPVVVSTPAMSDPSVIEALSYYCGYGALPESICAYVGLGVLPLEALPDWHSITGEASYELGLLWDFPFLLHMDYRMVIAGSATAFGLSVPFGFGVPSEGYFGSYTWLVDEFPLDPALTQCRRFCDHPTFDSAGVYHPTESFREAYAHDCYAPRYPRPSDDGYPLDP